MRLVEGAYKVKNEAEGFRAEESATDATNAHTECNARLGAQIASDRVDARACAHDRGTNVALDGQYGQKTEWTSRKAGNERRTILSTSPVSTKSSLTTRPHPSPCYETACWYPMRSDGRSERQAGWSGMARQLPMSSFDDDDND